MTKRKTLSVLMAIIMLFTLLTWCNECRKNNQSTNSNSVEYAKSDNYGEVTIKNGDRTIVWKTDKIL